MYQIFPAYITINLSNISIVCSDINWLMHQGCWNLLLQDQHDGQGYVPEMINYTSDSQRVLV